MADSTKSTKDMSGPVVQGAVTHGTGQCPCFPACYSKARGWSEVGEAKPRPPPDEVWVPLFFCGDPRCEGSWTEHTHDNGGRL